MLLGVIQEQHANRARLFAQWQEIEWPILHDPVNSLRAQAVPYFIAIDESGTVVDKNLTADEYEAFLKRPAPNDIPKPMSASRPELATLPKDVSDANAAEHRLLWEVQSTDPAISNSEQIDLAIEQYQSAIELEPDNPHLHFGLGVAYRMRFDLTQSTQANASLQQSPAPGLSKGVAATNVNDFQFAVDAWTKALSLDPNQYIYRRRIQQYGPRLSKPYPFYDWVNLARDEIKARGESPIALQTEPSGAEIASPIRELDTHSTKASEPDPQGRILRDSSRLLTSEVVIVPGQIQAGDTFRVHLRFRPAESAHWNNEAEPAQLWIQLPQGWKAETQLLQLNQPEKPESNEDRSIEFEITSPKNLENRETDGKVRLTGYLLYYVCEETGGQCLYRRHDFVLPLRLESSQH